MQHDIQELQERMLALRAQLGSGEVRYRLTEIYERLGDLLNDAPAQGEREGGSDPKILIP